MLSFILFLILNDFPLLESLSEKSLFYDLDKKLLFIISKFALKKIGYLTKFFS